jgi:hypothetical protein
MLHEQTKKDDGKKKRLHGTVAFGFSSRFDSNILLMKNGSSSQRREALIH